MKKLIIAEKPSVAKNIADATDSTRKNGYFEGEAYVITWAFGHLLQLYDARDYDPEMRVWRIEKFPYIPEVFRYKIKSDAKNKDRADNGAARQLKIIKTLAAREDIAGIISATDDDREGQIIADEILRFIEVDKPAERLLLNEWTAEEVNRGLHALRPNASMRPLQDAGFGRQIADWLIGINLTSVATLKYRNQNKVRLLNVGRVLMPTLKIIYDRDKEIADFQVTKYYKLKGTFQKEEAPFDGIYYEKKNEKFESPDYLKGIKEQITGKDGKVLEKKVTKKREYPPYLFNLSGLQGYITSKYKGWTSDRVLKVAQQLYEKKLITYPRTASVVLDESLKGKMAKVLDIHKKDCPYEAEIRFHTGKRLFDSKKVESHSAITPTYMRPGNLSDAERLIYEAIRNRFLAQFMPLAQVEDTVLTIKMLEADVPGLFVAKGKIQLVLGWKRIEGIDAKETVLPTANEGDILPLVRTQIQEVERKPPKPHTEKTLLKVMETCGKKYEEKEEEEMMLAILSGFSIGTPATRAETIKKLKDAGYIRAKGKSLGCTDLGRTLVETFPVRELFDLEYTGRLEKTLSDIEREKFTKDEFLTMIENFVITSVEKIKNDTVFGGSITLAPLHEGAVGICPECGAPVVETAKAFGCSAWKKGCKFVVWKDDRLITSLGKKVSYEMVKILLEHGKVGFHGCRSKRGNIFSAYFYYEKDEKTGRYRWRLEFLPNPRHPAAAGTAAGGETGRETGDGQYPNGKENA